KNIYPKVSSSAHLFPSFTFSIFALLSVALSILLYASTNTGGAYFLHLSSSTISRRFLRRCLYSTLFAVVFIGVNWEQTH
ncbi:hypothetical protein, partial [Vibrio parahaemolyticus]|uniref:hypothetical protein n=1 Tax=Vibrio parahaemolyticus TaxID=670 RepID=UPI001C5D3182